MQVLYAVIDVLGAVNGVLLVVNLFQPLLARRWPRLAAGLAAAGTAVHDIRDALRRAPPAQLPEDKDI